MKYIPFDLAWTGFTKAPVVMYLGDGWHSYIVLPVGERPQPVNWGLKARQTMQPLIDAIERNTAA